MASYNIKIKPSAVKDLKKLPKKDRQRIVLQINALSEDPRPMGCEKLSGNKKYRIRQGNYRILYHIEDQILVVIVVRIRHRKDVYRDKR